MYRLSFSEKRILDSYTIDYIESSYPSQAFNNLTSVLSKLKSTMNSDDMRSAPFFLRILGGSCSGKSTVAKYLNESGFFSCNKSFISIDDYTKNIDDQSISKFNGEIDWESPSAFDLSLAQLHFQELKKWNPVDIPNYDFSKSLRKNTTHSFLPAKVIVVEGISAGYIQLRKDEILNIKLSISKNDFFLRRLLRNRDFTSQEDMRYILKNMYTRHDDLETIIMNGLDILAVIENKFMPDIETRKTQYIGLRTECQEKNTVKAEFIMELFKLDNDNGNIQIFSSNSNNFFMYTYDFLSSPNKKSSVLNGIFFKIDEELVELMRNSFIGSFYGTSNIEINPNIGSIKVRTFSSEKITSITFIDRDMQ